MVQKNIKLVRWWILTEITPGEEVALPFTDRQELIFTQFMEDHPENFPLVKRDIFDSDDLVPPSISVEDQESDNEKPCILLIRAKVQNKIQGICRSMDIVLQNDQLPIQLPFDLAGEIILEKA